MQQVDIEIHVLGSPLTDGVRKDCNYQASELSRKIGRSLRPEMTKET